MRRAAVRIAAALALLAALTACSRENLQQIGLIGIEGTFEVDKTEVTAGEEVKMKAVFTGARLDENANVQFVVIRDGEPTTLKHRYEGDNTFTAEYRFEQSGAYDVDLHLYYEDVHIYKKKQVNVQ
jgi:flagellar hook assembly protein FlgD